MNSLQIKYFLTLARCNSFSKAAEELLIAQPTLSRSISSFESELGVKLFNRSYRSLTLTMEGNRYYNFFLRVDEEFRALNADIHPSKKQPLRIGMMEEMWLPVLNKSLREFKAERKIDIEFSFSPTIQLFGKLNEGKFDAIVIVDRTMRSTENFPYLILDQVPMGLYYNSQFYKDPEINFFRDEGYLYVPEVPNYSDSNTHSIQKALWELVGFEPKHQRRIENFAVLQMELECGRGFSILAEISKIAASKEISSLKLNTMRNLVIAVRDQRRLKDLELLVKLYKSNQKK